MYRRQYSSYALHLMRRTGEQITIMDDASIEEDGKTVSQSWESSYGVSSDTPQQPPHAAAHLAYLNDIAHPPWAGPPHCLRIEYNATDCSRSGA